MPFNDTKGYKRESEEEILENLQETAKNIFGDDIDLSPENSMGQILEIMKFFDNKNQINNEEFFYQNRLDTAVGSSLDSLALLTGIEREKQNFAKASLSFTVNMKENESLHKEFKITLPKGMKFLTTNELIFSLTEDKTITILKDEMTRTEKIEVICNEAGKIGNVVKDSITKIDDENDIIVSNSDVNPTYNVTNIDDAKNGKDLETDTSLRDRAKKNAGVATASSMFLETKLLDVDDVIEAIVLENDTNDTNKDGIPPHSIECIIRGGDVDASEILSKSIADVFLHYKGAGIGTFGEKTVNTVNPITNEEKTYHITIPKAVPLSVFAKFTLKNGKKLDKNNKDLLLRIQEKIANYINEKGLGKDITSNNLEGLFTTDVEDLQDLEILLSYKDIDSIPDKRVIEISIREEAKIDISDIGVF